MLEEENLQLREILTPAGRLPNAWGITSYESRALHAIARGNGSPVTQERIAAFIYSSQHHDRDAKIVDVYVCKIRKKGERHGLTIRTIYKFGWYMSPEDCARVRRYLEVTA